MSAGLQYHFGCAVDGLGGKFVSLCPWHAVSNGGVCHRLDKQIDIGRRGTGHANNGVDEALRYDFCFSEGVEDRLHFGKLGFGNVCIDAQGAHRLADEGRCVWHGANELDLFAKRFFDGSNGLASSDGDDDAAALYMRGDLRNHLIELVRLDGEKQNIAAFGDGLIGECRLDGEPAVNGVKRLLGVCTGDHLPCGYQGGV